MQQFLQLLNNGGLHFRHVLIISTRVVRRDCNCTDRGEQARTKTATNTTAVDHQSKVHFRKHQHLHSTAVSTCMRWSSWCLGNTHMVEDEPSVLYRIGPILFMKALERWTIIMHETSPEPLQASRKHEYMYTCVPHSDRMLAGWSLLCCGCPQGRRDTAVMCLCGARDGGGGAAVTSFQKLESRHPERARQNTGACTHTDRCAAKHRMVVTSVANDHPSPSRCSPHTSPEDYTVDSVINLSA